MPDKDNANTARGVIIKNGQILLIERWRQDESGRQIRYFSIPGGEIEKGETPEKAVTRELFEELSIVVRPQQVLAETPHKKGKHVIMLCNYLSGELHLKPEVSHGQSFIPCWIGKEQFGRIKLHPDYEPARQSITALLEVEAQT